MINVSEHDIHMLASTLVMEARSEGFFGQVAVGWVILNRLARPGWWSREKDTVEDDTIAAVCVDAWQFSAFNLKDPNLRYGMILPRTHPVYLKGLYAALAVITEDVPDPTFGACHYYAKSMKHPPPWHNGETPSYITDGHLFFNNIP